jgi:hypothetical protein
MGRSMKHFFKTCIATVAALMGLASFSAQAEILTLDYVTANFSGNCIDCAAAEGTPSYPVTATLVMKDVWPEAYSTKVGLRNFVSFSYSGSNLFAPYVISETEVTDFSGVWNAVYDVQLRIEKNLGDGTFLFFRTNNFSTDNCQTVDTDGNCISVINSSWSTGIGSYVEDYGNEGTWQVVSIDNNVPEPATLLMLCTALAGLRFTRRRRQV